MTKTQGELIRAIQLKLEVTDFSKWDLPTLQMWVNEASTDITRRTECNMAESSVSVTADVQDYNAPADTVRIHRVAYTPTGQTQEYDLQYIAYKNISNVGWTGVRSTSGNPAVYYTWGFPPALKINLYPIPSQPGTLKIAYFRTAGALGNNDNATQIDLPAGWEDLVIDYVVAEALMIDRDPRADMYKQRYNERLAAMAEAAINFVDQAGTIVEGTSMVPGWLYDPDGSW